MSEENKPALRALSHEGVHKYITFKLGDEEHGIELTKLRELIGLLEITRLPRAKPWIFGLINLRGKVIPVVDLRIKFGMPKAEPTSQSVIIVVQLPASGHTVTMGILVDEVLEVCAIREGEMEPAPALNDRIDMSFIQGVGKVGSRIVFLLDIERILSDRDETSARAQEGVPAPC
jgi:purine-binding chemotaxis protein CheW